MGRRLKTPRAADVTAPIAHPLCVAAGGLPVTHKAEEKAESGNSQSFSWRPKPVTVYR